MRRHPGFQERTHTQGAKIRERRIMLTVWTAWGDCHYFQQQLWQNSSTSEADSLTNDFSSYTCYLEVFVWKLYIGDHFLEILPVTTTMLLVQNWIWSSDNNVNHVRSVIVAGIASNLASLPRKFPVHLKRRISTAFCCHRLRTITVPPVAS